MARLIQKSGYIQGGRAARYMEYVAKRDGVEVLQSTEPVTKKQMQFLTKLLKDFPDAKELFEYADYRQQSPLHWPFLLCFRPRTTINAATPSSIQPPTENIQVP